MIKLDDFLHGRELEEHYLLKIDIDGQDLKVLKNRSTQFVQRISASQEAGLFDLAEPCYYDKVF